MPADKHILTILPKPLAAQRTAENKAEVTGEPVPQEKITCER